jgi:bacillithiol biosynthesis cysteine-adding enzyme BshC
MTLRWIARPFDQMPGGGGMFARLTGPDAPEAFPRLNRQTAATYHDSRFVDRAQLSAVLGDYNRRMNNPLGRRTLEAVAGDGLFVIAGQQPGLLTGPAYTLLKAIHAIGLAEQLSATWNRPVIPAFWVAGEDHDIAETNQVYLARRRFVCPHDLGNQAVARPPVAWLSPEPWRDDLTRFIGQTFPHADHLESALDMLGHADWSDYGSFFATLLAQLLGPGRIVLVDPFELRDLAAPLMAEAAGQWPKVRSAVTEQGEALLKTHGLPTALGDVNLFEFVEGMRRRIGWSDGRLVFHDQSRTPDQAAKLIIEQPQRFSPGAALRPVVQDAVMPVIATIGGPGELAYLWQIDPLYRLLGVERSKLQPRLSLTLVDQKLVERAGLFGLDAADLLQAPRRYERFDPSELLTCDASLAGVEKAHARLLDALESLDADGQADLRAKTRAAVDYHVNKLLNRLRLDRLARQGRGKELLKQVVDAVAPQGRPAERVVCGLEWVIRYGRAIVDQLIDQAPTAGDAHQLVIVQQDTKNRNKGADH